MNDSVSVIRFFVLLLTLMSTGCARSAEETAEARARRTGFRGVILDTPIRPPDFTLRDTEGLPFHFSAETDGFLTLLFFGYTHCPDICPVHLSNLSAVLPRFPYGVRSRIKVLFVTTDPDRDTATRMRTWLDGFDAAFTGLRGPLAEVNHIQESLGLPPAAAESSRPNGTYDVGHAAAVVAITPDGLVRVRYPFGTRQADWLHDLPRLLRTYGES